MERIHQINQKDNVRKEHIQETTEKRPELSLDVEVLEERIAPITFDTYFDTHVISMNGFHIR